MRGRIQLGSSRQFMLVLSITYDHSSGIKLPLSNAQLLGLLLEILTAPFAMEREINRGVSRYFESLFCQLCLLNAGFTGLVITWNHGRDIEARQSARLDRLLFNDEWRRFFPTASVVHLPHSYSDHCPLLLQTSPPQSIGLGKHPFRFVAAWMDHDDFKRVVSDA